MISVPDFLKRAADRNGFVRERFSDANAPTDFTSICIMPFFGDSRGSAILSSLLLNRYRSEVRGSKYFILASWPGMQGLFPYVDEYWAFNDQAVIKRFYEGADELRNTSDLTPTFLRNLNEFFREVIDAKDLQKYYRNGLTNAFFERFTDTKRFLPFIPSLSILGKEFNRDFMTKSGYKVFIHPSIFCKFWQYGTSNNLRTKREFWVELCKHLHSEGMTPVVWQNFNAWDIAEDVKEYAVVYRDNDMIRALCLMRSCSVVLDCFNGLGRFGLIARTPILALDEGSRYTYTREREIDDLLGGKSTPRQYIFTFCTILTDGSPEFWKSDIFRNISGKLDYMLPAIDRDLLASTSESQELVPYADAVHLKKRKRLGTRFIKIEHD